MTKDEDLVVYNDEQRWWVNVKENCMGAILRFEDSIKLQKELEILADTKILENAD